MDDLIPLRLNSLHERHPGLPAALGQSYAEAASVCFSRHHQPPVTLSLKHNGEDNFWVVDFVVPDERVRNAHANAIDATETGAYGVSLAAVEAMTGLVAVRRAETLTGADLKAANTFDDPKKVAPQELDAPQPRPTMTFKLPKASYTVAHLAFET